MRTRLLLALIAGLTLAACSGGGGGSSTTPSGGSNQTQSLTQQEIAQTGTEATFAAVEQGDDDNGLYSGNMGPSMSSLYRTPMSAFDGQCHNGVEKTKTVVNSSETEYDVKYFYDSACTELAREAVSYVTINGSGESITRTKTNYNHSELLLSTRNTNFSLTGSAGNFTDTITSELTIGTATSPWAQYGRTETVSTPSGSSTSTIQGNSGHTTDNENLNVAEEFGHTAQLVGVTETVDSSGDVTFAGGRNGTFYKGAIGSLTLSSSPPFTVTGGTEYGTASVTGSVTFDADGNMTAITINATLLNGDTVAMSGSGSPLSITGTVSSGGTTVATFVVDQFGDGVITYANGTQGQIVDWHVVK
jgi:hypothetical protein